MKHAVIVAHPSTNSFVMSMARAYRNAVQDKGAEVIVRDLYSMDFDPCLHQDELPGSAGLRCRPDVKAEREAVGAANVFAFIYPFWFNAPPAILKGYVDRVFGPGFGFRPGPFESIPLLKGRMLISVTSSGAPTSWVESTGAMEALRTLFDQHIALVCGMKVLDHLHFGGVGPGVRKDFVAGCASRVKALVGSINLEQA